jgi:hypothetical protein
VSFFRVVLQQQIMYIRSGPNKNVHLNMAENGDGCFNSSRDIEKVWRSAVVNKVDRTEFV